MLILSNQKLLMASARGAVGREGADRRVSQPARRPYRPRVLAGVLAVRRPNSAGGASSYRNRLAASILVL